MRTTILGGKHITARNYGQSGGEGTASVVYWVRKRDFPLRALLSHFLARIPEGLVILDVFGSPPLNKDLPLRSEGGAAIGKALNLEKTNLTDAS